MGFLTRASRYFDRSGDRAVGMGGVHPSAFAAAKVEAIRAYAEFCRTGKSPAYPLEIFLEISNICDLKCAMCVQFSALNVHRLNQIKGTPRGFMDQGEISENLEQALQHALLVHCFGYGEPTIHPTFRSFLDLISRYEVMIDFFTNGMHLDEDFCQFLVDRRVYQITVSFSGATKETYESIYLGGNFEKVLAGIKRLAEVKKAQGSRYPIIEINSLGFRDHVARFDDFVSLMADHGVNVVMLKPLQSHKTIPELYEHVSIMRPEQEGKIVKRALKIGRQRGIDVNADLYIGTAATGESDYDQQLDSLKSQADQAFGESGRRFGETPVSEFGAIAAQLEPLRDPGKERLDPRVISLDAPRVISRALLDVRAPDEEVFSSGPFHCMEPFKTLYISRNGAAKPCCFANPQGWYLGNAKTDNALSIWRGEGFEATRSAIAQAEYPMKSCEVCIRRKSGPQGHFARHMLSSYFGWHRQNFEQDLRKSIEENAPEALRLIGSSPSDIMAAARSGNAFASPSNSIETTWALEAPIAKTTEFIANRKCYLHRDFVSRGKKTSQGPSSAPAAIPPEFLSLLHTCAQRHYAGDGSIVDLGLPPQALQSLLGGLAENPRIDGIVGSFAARRDKLVERFDLAVAADDIVGSDRFVKGHVGNASNIAWLASKPIEMCLVPARAKGPILQRAFRRLLPFFIPGQTIVVQSDFYLQTKFYPKVLMGYLGGSFEWLGQAGVGAVFRFIKPVSPDLAGLDPYPALPTELCLRFHRQWENANLPRVVQMRLDFSYAQLLLDAVGREAAIAHLDSLGDRYADLLHAPAGGPGAYGRMLAHFQEKLAPAG